MAGTNIKYIKGLVEGTSFAIERSIITLLTDKADEYDDILKSFSISSCEHASALREQIKAEKEAVNAIAEFYKDTLALIKLVSNDVEQVEKHYGEDEHLTE